MKKKCNDCKGSGNGKIQHSCFSCGDIRDDCKTCNGTGWLITEDAQAVREEALSDIVVEAACQLGANIANCPEEAKIKFLKECGWSNYDIETALKKDPRFKTDDLAWHEQ